MNKITKQLDGTLSVPDIPTVPFITGDGVGEEITPAMRAIVNAAVDSSYGGRRRIEWLECLPVNVLITLSVRGCPTRQWMLLKNILSVSKGR